MSVPDQENSRPITRPMMRCKACTAWQTIDHLLSNGSTPVCGGCGGELAPVDWDEHFKMLPKAAKETP